MVCRVFMAIAEAGYGPGLPYLLSFFYMRGEIGKRIGVFLSASRESNPTWTAHSRCSILKFLTSSCKLLCRRARIWHHSWTPGIRFVEGPFHGRGPPDHRISLRRSLLHARLS